MKTVEQKLANIRDLMAQPASEGTNLRINRLVKAIAREKNCSEGYILKELRRRAGAGR